MNTKKYYLSRDMKSIEMYDLERLNVSYFVLYSFYIDKKTTKLSIVIDLTLIIMMNTQKTLNVRGIKVWQF